jgi:hypothetical protein
VTARVRPAVPRRLDAARDQAREAFARALRRDPEVRTSELGASFGSLRDSLLVELRDNTYILQVLTGAGQLNITVYRINRDKLLDTFPLASSALFFSYKCSLQNQGKLRKTALILLKKMQHAEVYEVMSA